MSKRNIFVFLLLVVILGCQAEPDAKKIPLLERKIIKKFDRSFSPAVDILFVIDDSGSMSTYQQKLADNAQLFIDHFFKTKFIDYHIGVITSSTGDSLSTADNGELVSYDGYNFVDRLTPEPGHILANLLDVGTGGDASEEFLYPIVLALSPNMSATMNRGFYRPNAQLAIFVLTDTEDQGSRTAEETFKFLSNLKGNNQRYLHYAASIIEYDRPKCTGEADQPVPNKLIRLASLHKDNGFVLDLCKQNYGKDLAIVARNVIDSVSTIELDELPEIDTIEVTFGGEVVPNSQEDGWVYNPDNNTIFLSPNIEIKNPGETGLNIKFKSIY